MSTIQEQILELVAKERHNEMVTMGIDDVAWEDKPKSYRKRLIKAETKRQKRLNAEMGIRIEPMVIESSDKPKKKGKKSK